MKTLFIAIPLPSAIQVQLWKFTKKLSPTITPNPAANLHITLAYLGPTDEAVVADIIELMNEVAHTLPAFEIHSGKLGQFPGSKALWAEVKDAEGALANLAAQVRDQLDHRRIKYDSKSRFRPHITLAYLADKTSLQTSPPQLAWPVDRFGLFESRPVKPKVYPELYSAKLNI